MPVRPLPTGSAPAIAISIPSEPGVPRNYPPCSAEMGLRECISFAGGWRGAVLLCMVLDLSVSTVVTSV